MGTLTAFLTAITAALRAFPLWLAWQQSEKLEELTDEIITLESRALPNERPRLERLRVKLANARKQHDALLALSVAPQAGPKNPDAER